MLCRGRKCMRNLWTCGRQQYRKCVGLCNAMVTGEHWMRADFKWFCFYPVILRWSSISSFMELDFPFWLLTWSTTGFFQREQHPAFKDASFFGRDLVVSRVFPTIFSSNGSKPSSFIRVAYEEGRILPSCSVLFSVWQFASSGSLWWPCGAIFFPRID